MPLSGFTQLLIMMEKFRLFQRKLISFLLWTHLLPVRMQEMKKFSTLLLYISALEKKKFPSSKFEQLKPDMCLMKSVIHDKAPRKRKVICNQQPPSPFVLWYKFFSSQKNDERKFLSFSLNLFCFVYVPRENVYSRNLRMRRRRWKEKGKKRE